jgi:hypothetical protein
MKAIGLGMVVLLTMLSRTAMAQSQRSLSENQKRACADDIIRLCAREFPEELKSCLKLNIQRLSRPCWNVIMSD